MKALFFNKTLSLAEIERPTPTLGEALIRVTSAGICNTDIEITRGYVPDFIGIPGHEFFGIVESVSHSAYTHLLGKRVTAEINCACNRCSFCSQNLQRHCPERTVIGINKRNGAFAEYISVPLDVLVPLPQSIPDTSALFIEPLAAALEILEQISNPSDKNVLIIGDGKLAHLIAFALKPTQCRMMVLGKHSWKVKLLRDLGVNATIDRNELSGKTYDIVIEASGSPAAFHEGLTIVKPRGIFVLKSTYAQPFSFNPAAIVVNELTLIGSRCGRFSTAIDFLEREKVDLSYLISKRFPLKEGMAAFSAAQGSDVLKVVIDTRV
jgi:2-desacetyl-2-hydroxyethyl bacteriochlorophyllide A dehydrogenase